MRTLQDYLNKATAWIEANRTDALYLAAIAGGLALVAVIAPSGRRR